MKIFFEFHSNSAGSCSPVNLTAKKRVKKHMLSCEGIIIPTKKLHMKHA